MHVFFNNSLFFHSFYSCPHGLVEGVVKQKVDRRGQGKGGGLENWQKIHPLWMTSHTKTSNLVTAGFGI